MHSSKKKATSQDKHHIIFKNNIFFLENWVKKYFPRKRVSENKIARTIDLSYKPHIEKWLPIYTSDERLNAVPHWELASYRTSVYHVK